MKRSNNVVARLRRRTQRGFTLVETMIATMVFTMGILGVYAMMLKSYELVTLSRHRDNGRALLLSFADQFLRLQTTDADPFTGLPAPRTFFIPSGPTGSGMSWTDTSGHAGTVDAQGLHVLLGEAGSSQIPATITRSVSFLDSTTGATTGSVTAAAAGWLLQGTFTVTYDINGRHQTQSLTVARSVR